MTPSVGLSAFSPHLFLLLADRINLLEYSLYTINFFCPLPSALDTFSFQSVPALLRPGLRRTRRRHRSRLLSASLNTHIHVHVHFFNGYSRRSFQKPAASCSLKLCPLPPGTSRGAGAPPCRCPQTRGGAGALLPRHSFSPTAPEHGAGPCPSHQAAAGGRGVLGRSAHPVPPPRPATPPPSVRGRIGVGPPGRDGAAALGATALPASPPPATFSKLPARNGLINIV